MEFLRDGKRRSIVGTPKSMLKKFERELLEVVLPTRQGVEIRKRCIAKPSEHQEILLHKLGLHLPSRFKKIEM